MKRASYRDAIDWIAGNDDTSWADYPHGSEDACATPSVAACLVRDIFGIDDAKLRKDVQHRLIEAYRCRASSPPAFGGDVVWRAEYYFAGSWLRTVGGEGPLLYASEAQALADAKRVLGKRMENEDA